MDSSTSHDLRPPSPHLVAEQQALSLTSCLEYRTEERSEVVELARSILSDLLDCIPYLDLPEKPEVQKAKPARRSRNYRINRGEEESDGGEVVVVRTMEDGELESSEEDRRAANKLRPRPRPSWPLQAFYSTLREWRRDKIEERKAKKRKRSRSSTRRRSRSGTKSSQRARSRSRTKSSRRRNRSPTRRRSRSGTRRRSKSKNKRRSSSRSRRERSRSRSSSKAKKGSLSPPPQPKSSTSRRPSVSNLPSTSSKKSKVPKAPIISVELTAANIKLEPGTASQKSTTAPGSYFKPPVPANINPVEGFELCTVCHSYFPDDEKSRNAHLSQHTDRVFMVVVPKDACILDIEEACEHYARQGFPKDELQKKIIQNQLVKYPTSLEGYSCKICLKFNGTKKAALEHIRDECKAAGTREDRALHLLPFCRGCNTKFPSEALLLEHIAQGKNACFPSPMTLNKIYDSVAMAAPPSPAVVAKKKQDELVRVKQEKQLEIKQEQLAMTSNTNLVNPNAINQFVTQQRNAANGNDQQGFQICGPPPQPPPIHLPSSDQMRQVLAQVGFSSYQEQIPSQMMPPNVQQQMMPPQMHQLPQIPPPVPSPFSYQQNFTAPPPMSPLPQQQFAAELPPPMPSPQYSRSPTPTNQGIRNLSSSSLSSSLSSHLLGQMQEPKRKPGRPVVQRDPPQPILPPLSVGSRKERKEKMVVMPPVPAAPLSLDVWNSVPQQPLVRQQHPALDPSLAPQPLFEHSHERGSIKGTVQPEACKRGLCEWNDIHAAFCTKPEIIDRCSQKLCSTYDRHRTDYILGLRRQVVYNCDKLKFYCNTGKTANGNYQHNDSMTSSVPTKCLGKRESGPGVTEGKQKNPDIPDPRLKAGTNYCAKPAEPVRKLPGTGRKHPSNQKLGISKDQFEWSRKDTVVSYSAITQGHVKVRGFGFNPHIVEEEEDDLEVVDEVAGADDDVVELGSEEDEGPGSPVSPDSMKRKRKAAKNLIEMLGLVARPNLVSLPHTSLSSKADLIVTCKGLSCSSTSMKTMLHRPASTTSADIVVSGGGMVGTAAAATIAKLAGMQNKRIILLESSSLKEYSLPQVPSNRVAALSPATVSLLDRLGAWQIIKRMRAQPIKRMKVLKEIEVAIPSVQVWESCSDAAIAFGGGEQDEPLAHIVENDLTVNALTEVTQSCSNVDVRYGAKVKSYSIPDLQHSQQVPTSPVKIELENGDEIECELLVGADGGQSLVRKSLGRDKDMLAWQYHQMGLVATLQVSSDEANVTAWQRFLPSGPIALLPLGPTSSSLVWTVPKSELQGLLSLGDENFVEAVNLGLTSRSGEQGLALALTKGVQTLLGGEERPNPPTVVNVSQRAAFPLGFGHSPYYVGPRTALVGDSAHRVHPLAGQGANLGFGDVCELADQVQRMILDGAGLGHRDYLKMYESARLQHNVPTMLGIDGLQKLYCNSLPPLVIARSLGLALTAASTPLRKLLQSHAAA